MRTASCLFFVALILGSEAIAVANVVEEATSTRAALDSAKAALAPIAAIQADGNDVRTLESVTEVKESDGTVVSTTRVSTENLEDGNSVTHIHRKDGSGPEYATNVYNNQGSVEHHAAHSLTTESGKRTVVNVAMGNEVSVLGPVDETEGGSDQPTPPKPSFNGDKMANDIISYVNTMQGHLDKANIVWFVIAAVGVVAALLLFPAMEKSEDMGSVGWTFWTSMLVFMFYLISMSWEFIAIHAFIKIVLVSFGNLALKYVQNIVKKLEDVGGLAGLNLENIADKIGLHQSHIQALKATNIGFQNLLREKLQEHSLIAHGFNVDDVIDEVTTVPFQEMSTRGENICRDAWVTSATARMAGQYLYYSAEGPVEAWSPIAKWNMNRAAHEKKIPNPSNCDHQMGADVDETMCPGHKMFLEGADDYCDCYEVMLKLGFEPDFSAGVSCFTDRRDYIFTLLKSVLRDEQTGEIRSNDLLSSGATCAGTYEAGIATSEGATSNSAYDSTAHIDGTNSVFSSESIATLSSLGSGLSWSLSQCQAEDVIIEFRYASAEAVGVEVFLDNVKISLADSSNELSATGGADLFARNNAVVSKQSLTPGPHTLKIVRTTNGGDLRIHRAKLCHGGTSTGCEQPAAHEAFCYQRKEGFAFASNLEGASVSYASFGEAMGVCNSRMDCEGVQVSGTTYVLKRGGTTASAAVVSYERTVGVAESVASGMCV